MAYNVIVTEPAAADIDETVTFIKGDSAAAAAMWLGIVQGIIEQLDEMPYRGARIPENTGQKFECRHLIYKSHRIVYRVDETAKTVFVVRVYHSARTPLRTENLG